MVPGGAHGQSRGTVKAGPGHKGTIVVSGRSGLGRHVDVPERNGAAGGLVPEQQGRRVCVPLRVRPGPGLLHARLGAGAQALGQDLLDGPAQVGVQSALCLVEHLQGEGLECAGAEVLVQRDGVHAGHLGRRAHCGPGPAPASRGCRACAHADLTEASRPHTAAGPLQRPHLQGAWARGH